MEESSLQQLLNDPTVITQALELAWPVIVNILLALVVMAIGWFASKWTDRATTRALSASGVNLALARFLGTAASWAVLGVTLVGALGRLGIATTSLLTVLASAGLAIGLALKGTLGNFASGIVLLVFRPFKIDDIVEVAGVSGVVKDIGLWATTLDGFNGDSIVVPNAQLTDNVMSNSTRRGERRISLVVGVEYGSDLSRVRKVLGRSAARVEPGLEQPAPEVRLTGFGGSSVDFEVLLWVKPDDYVRGTQLLADAIYADLNEADIGIPFEQLVLHHKDPVEVAQAAK